MGISCPLSHIIERVTLTLPVLEAPLPEDDQGVEYKAYFEPQVYQNLANASHDIVYGACHENELLLTDECGSNEKVFVLHENVQ